MEGTEEQKRRARELVDEGMRLWEERQDSEGARKCWREAAELGHPWALEFLLIYDGQKALRAGDHQTARKIFQRGDRQGFAAAALNLGILYEEGKGVPADLEKALAFYEKAAGKGNAEGMYRLALMLRETDEARCRRLMHKAAAKGSKDAQAFLEDGKEARLEKADALYNCGFAAYHRSDCSHEEAAKQAVDWWRQAAELGMAEAAATIARLYERGDGVTVDPDEALRWHTCAAENGDVDEMIALGDRYRDGVGVEADEDAAFRWYMEATHKHSAVAALRVSDIWSVRAGRDEDRKGSAAAFRWCKRAAEKGLTNAKEKLGLLYYRGEGIDRDPARSREWFEAAAAEGSETAKLCLEELNFTEPVPEVPEIDFSEGDDEEGPEDLLERDDAEASLTAESLHLYPIEEALFHGVRAVLARSFFRCGDTPFYDGDGRCFIGAGCDAETFRRIYDRARMEVLSRETGDFCVTAEETENETYLRALLSFAGKGTYVVCDGKAKTE